MPKARKPKRKTPVTASVSSQAVRTTASSSRPQATRTTIRRFHVLLKRQAQLQQDIASIKPQKSDAKTAEELADVEREIEIVDDTDSDIVDNEEDEGQGSSRL